MRQQHTPHFVSSVVPRVIVRKAPYGFEVEPGEPRKVGQEAPIMVVSAQISLFIMALLIISFFQNGPPSLYKLIPLTIILVLLIARLAWKVGRDMSIGPAKLTVSDWPFCLGSSTRIQFQQQTQNMRVSQLKATIECVEITRVPDYKGRLLRTEATVWKHDLPAIAPPADSTNLEAAWTITLPSDLPPSFDGTYNVIAWRVVIELVNDIFPKTFCNFLLHVMPEVHADAIYSDQ